MHKSVDFIAYKATFLLGKACKLFAFGAFHKEVMADFLGNLQLVWSSMR